MSVTSTLRTPRSGAALRMWSRAILTGSSSDWVADLAPAAENCIGISVSASNAAVSAASALRFRCDVFPPLRPPKRRSATHQPGSNDRALPARTTTGGQTKIARYDAHLTRGRAQPRSRTVDPSTRGQGVACSGWHGFTLCTQCPCRLSPDELETDTRSGKHLGPCPALPLQVPY